MGWDDAADDVWKYRNAVNTKVNIIELIQEYGIKLERLETGQFTHRACCPFHAGKDGGIERTPSFFVSEKTNSFFCFGCNIGGLAINFVSRAEEMPPTIALTKLAKRVKLMDKDGNWDELELDALVSVPTFDPTKTIEPYLIEIGEELREYVLRFVNTPSFHKELNWMEKIGKKVDDMADKTDDWEVMSNILKKVRLKIQKRMKK